MHDPYHQIINRQTRYQNFVAKLILFIRLPLGYTFYLGSIKAIDLLFIPSLLLDNATYRLEHRRVTLYMP